jgi:hypothetical protein
VRLTELAQALGRAATLNDFSDAELDRLAEQGFDWIWLLSVWQTGPASQRVSRSQGDWRREFERTLADLREEDTLKHLVRAATATTGRNVRSSRRWLALRRCSHRAMAAARPPSCPRVAPCFGRRLSRRSCRRQAMGDAGVRGSSCGADPVWCGSEVIQCNGEVF